MKKILVDAVNTFVNKEGEIDVELFSLLEKFENPKIILTNVPKEIFPKFGLDNVPYPVFTLEKNPTKLDPTYFEIFLERNNLMVKDVIYFEHNKEAIASAESIGINSYYFDPEKRDITSLQKFLENNL